MNLAAILPIFSVEDQARLDQEPGSSIAGSNFVILSKEHGHVLCDVCTEMTSAFFSTEKDECYKELCKGQHHRDGFLVSSSSHGLLCLFEVP